MKIRAILALVITVSAINAHAQLTATVTTTDAICFGSCDGIATATASGGVTPYTYIWDDSNMQTTAMATGLCAGTYTVNVLDNIGDSTFVSGTVAEPAQIFITTSAVDASCNGLCDGMISAAVSGGTGAYTYMWDDPMTQTTATAFNLCAGVYVVYVTDANGCTALLSSIVNEPTIITVTISSTDVSCSGGSDGSATASVTGGTTPYTYSWNTSPVQTGATATGLSAGTYIFTVTDPNGCVANANITITEPASITTLFNPPSPAATCGSCDATTSVIATGGTPLYTYIWSDGQATSAAAGLCVGTYTVTVTDMNGCTSSNSVTVTGTSGFTFNGSAANSTCGSCDGSATSSVSGGTSPYMYLWDDPLAQTTANAINLCPATYILQVTDSAGCVGDTSYTISNTGGLTAVISNINNVICPGACDGNATVAASGGTTPYTYLWSDSLSQVTATAANLCNGSYTVTVTDAIGCVEVVSAIITQPQNLSLTSTSTSSSCGQANGSACVSVTGGTAPYVITWDDPFTTVGACIDSALAGVYNPVVVDSNGCSFTTPVIINDIAGPTVGISAIDATCGVANGSATATVSGGTSPYTYIWDDPGSQTSQTAINLAAGTYTCVITDNNGCVASASATIGATGSVSFGLTVNDATCSSCDGSAASSPSGGTPPYTYAWSDSSFAQTADSLCAGSHSLQITDSVGCVSDTTFSVNNIGGFTASISFTSNVTCNGDSNGIAVVSATGGTLPYTYSWDDPMAQANDTAFNLPAGTYNASVTDAAGCTFIVTAIISQPAVLVLVGTATNSGCGGGSDGTVTATVTGGTSPYTYLWNDSLNQTTATAVNLSPGTYTCDVTDGAGCSGSASAIVILDTNGIAISTNLYQPSYCGGYGYGYINVSGGTSPYTYAWDVAPYYWYSWLGYGMLAPGAYNVTVTSANGCSDSIGVTITNLCLPNLILGNVFNDANGNCTLDTNDYALSNWIVRADPGSIMATTDYYGDYEMYLDSGNYTLSLIDTDPLRSQACPSSPNTYTLNLGSTTNTVNNMDFAVQPDISCAKMEVDISTWAVRNCRNNYYSLYYCNNGTVAATNATIVVELDTGMSYTSFYSWPTVSLASIVGDVITFDLGAVNPMECGYISVRAFLVCDMSLLGSTQCVKAHIYPDSSCTAPDSTWDKSSVMVEGTCVSDSMACFNITNTGDPGNGDMQGPSDYRIYRNNILIDSGTFQLAGGASIAICYLADSSTIRLEADQRPGHPGNSHPQDNVEMCGSPSFILGQITSTQQDDLDPFVEIDCHEVTGSYDPNDKAVQPKGLTDAYHYIDSTDLLEYTIRFQNTGNDTAFNVFIRDTLSQYVDIATLESGVSSHPYTVQFYDNDVVQWDFANIMLPDSNVNEPESHGFVKFKIQQIAGNADGTVIKNSAAIYFDYNDPVITNTVFNTIGDIEALTTYMPEIYDDAYSVEVYPNPFSTTTTIQVDGLDAISTASLEMYNIIGEKVKSFSSNDSKFIVNRNQLPSGIYFYNIKLENKLIGAGKLIVN